MGEAEGKFRIVEWTIENFSNWNSEIHEKVITSPDTSDSPSFGVDLYPRGFSGNGEHMVVHARVCDSGQGTLLSELSYISSDGSLLCTQQVDSAMDGFRLWSEFFFHLGPKFEEVVAKIRKEEALHKDRLTLRLRLKDRYESVEYLRTKIGAFRTTLKISSSYILDHLEGDSLIIRIRYEEYGKLALTFSKLEWSKIELTLKSGVLEQKMSVFTRMAVLNKKDVVRTEENENLFLDDDDKSKWIFSNSLTTEEMAMEGFSLILCIKIISKDKIEHYGGFSYPGSSHTSVKMMPSNGFGPPGTNVPQECLSNELMCLYQYQEFSDFQLKCGDVSIPVHKNILSARSPVFKAMLSCDMKEAASGCMDIVDLEPSTLGLFLNFLYTGGTEEELQGESALKLYYAADKYQVTSLKKECADFLSDNVSISNVCDILSLADKHQDGKLTGVAHDFILKNFDKVMKSQEWKSFMRSEPLLAVETVTHFAELNRVGEISSAT